MDVEPVHELCRGHEKQHQVEHKHGSPSGQYERGQDRHQAEGASEPSPGVRWRYARGFSP